MSKVSSVGEKIKSFLSSILGKEALVPRLRGVKSALSTLTTGGILHAISLGLIIIIAVILRTLPLRWGFYLSEFDPYVHYRTAQYIIDHGFQAYFSWHDNMTWYPWGRNMPLTQYPGLGLTAAISYLFLRSIGVAFSLYDFVVVFPIIAGVVTVLAAYLLGKEIAGKSAALFSALFMAFSTSSISRTSLGFFRHETIQIPAMLFFFMFYLKAISPSRTLRSSLIYSILAALSLSYISFTTSAFRYPLALMVLFSIALVFLGKYSRRVLLTFVITYGLYLVIATQLPLLGYTFLTEWSTLSIAAGLVVMLLKELMNVITNTRSRIIAVSSLGGVLALAAVVLWGEGTIISPAGRMVAVVFPTARLALPIVESVAEHRPATWASFFYEFGIVALLGIVGLLFAAQRRRENDIFIILFGLSSLYFAASLVRLTLILSPAFAILAALTVVELSKPSVDIVREMVIFPKKKIRLVARVGREFGIAILLVLLLITIPTFYNATKAAYSPATIATSSIPVAPSEGQEQKYQDWLQALAWMHDNLPSNAVVMSWWDYGYWITQIADKRSMADNGTINSTQVALIGATFLSNETVAIPILKRYNVTHIAVFVTWEKDQSGKLSFIGLGEDNKWYWMARIGNGTRLGDAIVNFYEKRSNTPGQQGQQEVEYYRVIRIGNKIAENDTIADSKGIFRRNTLLGKLMWNVLQPDPNDRPTYFNLVYQSQNRWVLVYEIYYPHRSKLSLNLEEAKIDYGKQVKIYGKVTIPDVPGAIGNSTIGIEYSPDNGETWNSLGHVISDVYGNFVYYWIPDAGNYSIRASWDGRLPDYDRATSPSATLSVEKALGSLDCSVKPASIVVGQNASIHCRGPTGAYGGNLTAESSADGSKWTLIGTGQMFNGSFIESWLPQAEGNFYVRVAWTGNENYLAASSAEIKVSVTKKT